MAIETQRVSIGAADGIHLDGDLRAVDGARAAVVLCHPHPLYGGNRFNPVVDTLFAALPGAGVTALRFDFRGVGDSEGTHDGGTAEQLDLAAAVDLLATAADVPVWAVGYSFGALVTLSTAHAGIHGYVAIAPPLALMFGDSSSARFPGAPPCASDDRPVRLIVPRHDQYSQPDAVAPIIGDWTNTSMSVIESADHFLAGHQQRVAQLVVDAIG